MKRCFFIFIVLCTLLKQASGSLCFAEPPAIATPEAAASPSAAVSAQPTSNEEEYEEENTPTPKATPTPTATRVPRVAQTVSKFGIILPLSGPNSMWGKNMLNAAKMAFEDLDSESQKKMALIFEDDQMKGPVAISAYRKLVDVDAVSGVVVFGVQSVAAVAPLAEKDEIPLFALTASKESVKGLKFSFRHWLDASEQIKALLYFLEDREMFSVSLIQSNHESIADYASKFVVAAAQANVSISSKHEIDAQVGDFKSLVAAVKDSGADAMILAVFPPQLSGIAKAMRDAGVDLPFFGFSWVETPSEVTAATGALDGTVFAGPKMSRDFVKRFQDKYDSYPDMTTPNVYDMVKIFAASVKTGGADPRAIAAYIRRLKDFNGVLGQYSITAENEFTLGAELKKIKRGSFRRLDEQ